MGHLIILASALLHATWNAMLKRAGSGPLAGAWVLMLTTLFTWIGVALTGSLDSATGWEDATSPLVRGGLLAGVFEGIYFVSLQRALERYPLGWTYLVTRSGAMALVWGISSVILGETLRPLQILGVLGVSAGIYFSQGQAQGQGASGSGRLPLRAWFLAGICAASIAGYHFSYKHFLEKGVAPFPLFGIAMSVSTVIFLSSFAFSESRLFPSRLPAGSKLWVLGAGLLCATSFLLYLYGLPLMGAGVALTLRNTSILFAQLLAWWGGERLTPKQWMAAVLVFLGALLI